MIIFYHFIRISLALSIPTCCPSGSSASGNFCECENSYYLVDNKICVNLCPSLFKAHEGNQSNSSNTCSVPNGNDAIIFELKFSNMQDLEATYIANSANPNEKFINQGSILYSSPTQNSPLPTIDRGFYFSATSSMISDQNYVSALYFTLNLWIKPLADGEILNVISGQDQYIRTWADSSGVYKFSGIIYDTKSNAFSILGVSSLSYIKMWHKLSVVLRQISCSDTMISFYINLEDAGSTIINNSEAKFLVGRTYIWNLGKNGPENSFRGFIYWLQARSDVIASSFSDMDSTIECVDNQYWDGSTCQNCASNCSAWPWCVRGNSCSICYTLDCIACHGYSSSMCTSCISNEPGSLCSYQPAHQARLLSCYTGCTLCTGPSYYLCASCSLSYFLYSSNLCLSNCPTGYTENSSTKTCDFSSITGFGLGFNDKIILDSISGISVGSSNTNSYPNYDDNDPYPAYLRGYYFTGTAYLLYQIVTGPFFTISIWINPTAAGTIVSKAVSGNEALCLEITSSGYPKLSLILSDSSAFSVTLSASVLNSWNFVAFTGKIDAGYTTTIKSYLNSIVKDSDSSTNQAYFQDSSSGLLYIGTKQSLNSGFVGFLYDIIIYNINTMQNSDYFTSSCASPCLSCPIDHNCIDTCPLSKYYDGSSCVDCKGTCTKGCRFADTCGLCKTKQCYECTSFSGSCSSCIINAEFDGSGGCKCKDNTFWQSNLERCEMCEVLCAVCKQTTYFECDICVTGKQLVGNICINDCPYGYGLSCSSVSDTVIDQPFDIDFQGSYGIFTTGASSSTYHPFVSPEIYDPVPAYKRGLYFDGNMYLLSSTPVYLSHSFSIGAWIYVITNGDFLQKQSRLILSSTGSITAIMDDSLQVASTHALSPTSLFTGWSYLSITIYYTSNSSHLSIYIFGMPAGSSIIAERVYRDIIATNLQLGKSNSSGFIGFIYYFQLWNVPISDFSIYINDFVCGTGLGYSCLWSCDLSHYFDGENYLACNSCSKGCVREKTCNICYDLLCSVCIGFDSGKCIQCVANASGAPNPCICDTNYTIDTLNGSTCIPVVPDNEIVCPDLCSTCESLTKCTTCVENASLKPNLCYCNLGYNGSKNCTYIPFSARLSVLSDNSLYLIFSDKLAHNLTTSNFTIKIQNQGEISYKIEQINGTYFYISLKMKNEVNKGTLATLEFLDLEEMISVNNGMLNSSEINVTLNAYDPAPYSAVIESVTAQTSAASQAAISGAAVLAIVNSNPSSLWSIINTMQILSYLTLSGIPLSAKIKSFLNSLNSFSLFPNIFIFFIDKNEGNAPYSQAQDFGFDSDLILLNQGGDFTLILVSVSMLPLILFFSRCSCRYLGKKFLKTLKAYQFSFFLRFWIQSYLELGAAASIGFVTASLTNVTQITNLIICTFIYFLLALTPPIYLLFSYKNKNHIQSREKSFFSLFSTFFYEFKKSKRFLATQYYFVFFGRRLVYIINLVLLRDYPETEVTVNIVLSLITIMHLWFFWPFEDLILQIGNLITEILIGLVMCSTTVYLFYTEQEIVSAVEIAIVATVLAIMVVQLFCSIAIFAKTLYKAIQNKLAKASIMKSDDIKAKEAQLRKVKKLII